MYCEHVYKITNVDICLTCGKDTHEINWEFIKNERIKHREKYGLFYTVREWWSI